MTHGALLHAAERHDAAPEATASHDPLHNEDVPWNAFDTNAYYDHNYKKLRDDDRFILQFMGRFFAATFASRENRVNCGIDVGTGSNLYPALAMLPWCDHVLLTDHSEANLEWLRRQYRDCEASWEDFWDVLASIDGYPSTQEFSPFQQLAERVKIEARSVFALPRHVYDVGTMFFVAESMTSFEDEFERATRCFLGCLKPGAPFAAAFMDSSKGYEVGTERYPAVGAVTAERVRETLGALRADARVEKVPIPPEDPLRDGYEGMIIAVGTTRA